MSSIAGISNPQPAIPRRRHLIASAKIASRRAVPTPTLTGKTCVWCGRAIYETDLTERIGLAELHRVPCVEQFDLHADGPEGDQ